MSNDDCDKWLEKKADKGMNADRLFTLVGMTNTDHDVIDAIKANGGSIDALSPKKLKDLTIDFVGLNDLGVVLAFTPKLEVAWGNNSCSRSTYASPISPSGFDVVAAGTQQSHKDRTK
ncbi:hypothetical protein U0027_25265 (plasmid) [Agrobacterium tumefaciens]|uniref:hypothetical protein n=1 Tax=Agrobacterium tumefaciens TaxID=358 RepID=UPI000E0B3DE7|nr:hypothetical protein [Agrobacterium tumefaciens]WQE43348.1 hypothetical protein U0027_25265 [Agrobacterium tumefaciens]